MIVHLNGWPGAGKKTIGAVLARKLGARFIHNHLLHDVAIACADLRSVERWELYEVVRAAAYAELTRRPLSETFVMTNALCNDTPREVDAWTHVVDLAISRNVPLVPVVLELSEEENCRRVQSPERLGKKLSDPMHLKSYFGSLTIQKPDVPELLVVDVTVFTPADAADAIISHLKAVGRSLQPASQRHLKMRLEN